MGDRGLVFGFWPTAVALALSLLGVAPVAAQAPAAGVAATSSASDWSAPRTPWGHPDLQGIWTTDDEVSVAIERPEDQGERLELSEEEIAARTASRETDGELFVISSESGPDARLSRTVVTRTRVPAMHALPWQISGSTVM